MNTTGATTVDADLDLDLNLGEQYYKDDKEFEHKAIEDLVDLIHKSIERRFREGSGPAHRDAHAGDNGCVRAIFRVDPDLDRELQHGAFIPGREYEAWIRFSNGNSEVKGSRWPDARGMAIKLMGVKGDKLMPDEKETQDFILLSSPAFFVDDLERYQRTLADFLRGSTLIQWLSVLHLRGREIWLALRTNFRFITNPLFQQYWSATPYRLGTADAPNKTAVKYTAKPRRPPERRPFDGLRARWGAVLTFFSPGFSLKTEMNNALASREMWFDFYLQTFVDHDRTPIEDSKVEWKENWSPLRHVAKIVIPCQDIMSAERAQFCEDLSYSPWHGLPAHRPLGLVNRVRRRAYTEISQLRHRLNRRPSQEPTAGSPPASA